MQLNKEIVRTNKQRILLPDVITKIKISRDADPKLVKMFTDLGIQPDIILERK